MTPPKKTVTLPAARVSEDLRRKLEAEADRRQTSISALIREALIAFFSTSG